MISFPKWVILPVLCTRGLMFFWTLPPAASHRTAGAGPLPPGLHDEVLSIGQGEGRDEENHWPLWTNWQTAGMFVPWGYLSLVTLENGRHIP